MPLQAALNDAENKRNNGGRHHSTGDQPGNIDTTITHEKSGRCPAESSQAQEGEPRDIIAAQREERHGIDIIHG